MKSVAWLSITCADRTRPNARLTNTSGVLPDKAGEEKQFGAPQKGSANRQSALHTHSLTPTLAITHFKGNFFALLHILLAGALQHR